jgi:tetratricopeptide (TPR) repeat protein
LATSRIEQLRQLIANDPTSTFARYGLAMAYVQQGELEQAIPEFEAVLRQDLAYSAAYYHGGQTCEKLGRLDQARDFYRRGLAASSDPHARGELQAALDILSD